MPEANRYCSQCGHAVGSMPPNQTGTERPKRLHRSLIDKKIGGVCAGLAEYLEVDVVFVRVLAATAIIVSGGLGLLAYIAAWIIMPLERSATFEGAPNTFPVTR